MRKNIRRIVIYAYIITMLVSCVGISVQRIEAAVTVYSQTDSRWGSHYYGYKDTAGTQRATISSGGCGILAYVNAVHYLNGQFIEPTFLADYSVNNGYRVNGVGTSLGLYKAFANTYGSQYNFKYSGSTSSYSTLKNHLQSGGVAVGSAPGHLMAVVDYDNNNGKYLVLDSYASSNRFTYPSGYTWQTESVLENNYKTNFGTFELLDIKTSVIFDVDNRYKTPITVYPAATSGKITLYNSSLTAYSQSTRYIAYDDLCTINTVYTNGYCSVTYPTSSGTNTEYAKTSDFIPNGVTPYSWTPSGNMTTYTRSDLSTVFGSISSADNCTVVGESGSALQIVYPLNSGGYKLGWVTAPTDPIASDFPTPLKAFNVSSSTDTTVYASVDTMNTYYGEIFPTDECTLNAVNISGGWINITYPAGATTKTGYVELNEFVPTSSKLTTFYTTTVTQQSTSYRKPDMATSYGHVSVGDPITVVGKDGNKLQVLYPLDAGGYKLAWIYDTYVMKNLTGISVTANPSKTTYIEGESLNTSGLVITANYDDGSTANITGSCTFSGYSNTVGVKTITVSYGGKQTAFTVTVKSKSPTSIKITSNPAKTNYYIGDEINLSGLSVQATYDNGTTANVDDYNVLFESDITSSAGNKTIIISYVYNGVEKSTSFNITIISEYDTESGDVNGDGACNMKDLSLFQQYLNGWDVAIIASTADVNGDGTCNMKDLALLQQYLNGWDVKLK